MFHKSAVRPARSTLVLAAAFAASIGCAKANVVVHVDKNQQRMTVEVDGVPRYEWAVSTGRAGYGYGYGYGTGAYPGYQSYPSYSRGWYGSFGY